MGFAADPVDLDLAALAGSSDPHTFDPLYIHKRKKLQIFGAACQLNYKKERCDPVYIIITNYFLFTPGYG